MTQPFKGFPDRFGLLSDRCVPLCVSVEVVREEGFHLGVEDYLAGVLIMASELVGPPKALLFLIVHESRNGKENRMHLF